MIKKLSGLALLSVALPVFAFAQDASTTTPTKISYNPTCASAAVVQQENAIQAAQDAFYTTMKAASITRRDALAAAFLKSDATERQSAIQAARDASRTTEEAARKTMQAAIKVQMETNKTAMAACGADMPKPMMDNKKDGGNEDQDMGQGDEQSMGDQNDSEGMMAEPQKTRGNQPNERGGKKAPIRIQKDKKGSGKKEGRKGDRKEGAMMQAPQKAPAQQ